MMNKSAVQNITFVVYSRYGPTDIRDKIGVAEYSYYFVARTFVPLLRRFGEVRCLSHNDDLGQVLRDLARSGCETLLLAFAPPHAIPNLEDAKVIPVFAWEYDTLPTEDWDGTGSGDWLAPLKTAGCAVTHSAYSVAAARQQLGPDYAVFNIPSPVWDAFSKARRLNLFSLPYRKFSINFHGIFLDSRAIDYRQQDEAFWQRYRAGTPLQVTSSRSGDVCQAAIPGSPQTLTVSGVIYTSIFNPFDGRKNWESMITAFCHAHRNNPRATLIIKISANHYAAFTDAVVDALRRLEPIQCRVIVIYGYLEQTEYEKLLTGTSFYVNTSYAEGQCIPLMEFLSAGIPALSPKTTAMKDYIRCWHSLVIDAHQEPTHWQHDPREKYRCMHYRVDWQSLFSAYRRSFWLAMPWGAPLYKLMQLLAMITMYSHCSVMACQKELKRLLKHIQSVNRGADSR